MTRLLRTILLSAVACAVLPSPAPAQDYPTRPITVVVSFPPGASTDAVARLTRDPLSESLGQPLVIDNRPGAGGTIGSAVVAKAAPDGYTLLVTVNPPLVQNMYIQKNFPYDARTAFAPIAIAADSVLVLAVNSALPVRTVPELVEYAKKNPGKLSYGSAGIGSGHHIAGELIKQKTGIDMTHVPYRGTGPAIQDLVAGQIQISFGTTPAVLPHANAGKIRILALAEAKRHPDLPGIPTIDETLPGVVTNTWVGFLAPAGTPRPIIEKLNKAVVAALKRPEIVEKFKTQGLTVVAGTPEAMEKAMREEYEHWGKVIPAIGIQAE
jgi:tripartite-type tricarboxylate transporter receptor subunit TctC